MKRKENPGRVKTQKVMGLILPLMLTIGLIWPYAGLAVMGMMIGFLILSIFKGRLWCGYVCPRGSFMERWFARISRNREIPRGLKNKKTRRVIFILMMGFMGFQIWNARGSLYTLGAVFIRICVITSVIAVVTGYLFRPRTWCSFCPMGTLQGILGRKRYKLTVNENCNSCTLCSRHCPIGTKPYEYKNQGYVESEECLKCENCVLNCPRKALKLSA